MKICVCMVLIAVAQFALLAMSSSSVYRTGAEAKVTFRIVDEEQRPVSNAVAHVWFCSNDFHQNDADWEEVSGAAGLITVTHKTNYKLVCRISKDGYYESKDTIVFPKREGEKLNVVDGKWQPYGEMRTVVLKRMRKPQDMLGPAWPPQRKIKFYDIWLGFDLEKGDFVPPVGNGCESDMFVRFHLAGEMPYDWSIRMDVTFTNYPYAGAYRLKMDDWSDMKSVYQADTNANYVSELTFRYAREKGNRRPIVEKLEKDEYLVFRTRTKVDREGKLQSARYGKLYGPWNFEDAGGSQIYKVFLNAKDNDVNLEDMWTIETAKKYRRDH